MLSAIKRIVDHSPALSSLNYLKGQVWYRLGVNDHLSGATHRQMSPEAGVQYIQSVVADYLRYAGVEESFLEGKRVLEIGPGDNLGVALAMVGKGAEQVVCFDRFRPFQDADHNEIIYRRLLATMTPFERQRAERSFAEKSPLSFRSEVIDYRCDAPIETALSDARFDVIISRAVLEHVYDLEQSWRSMTRLLAPAGQMWHKVDFRHHGFFGQFHPLFFLTVPARRWEWISSPDPTLNRRLTSDYRRLATESFEYVVVYHTHILDHEELIPHSRTLRLGKEFSVADVEQVRAIRPRLSAEFRERSEEDLLCSGIFLICRRPREGSTLSSSEKD